MSGDPRLHALEQERQAAQGECVRLQQGWGASQQHAQEHLDAKEHLIGVLETIESIDPYYHHGMISGAIESHRSGAARIRAEIPTLKPGY